MLIYSILKNEWVKEPEPIEYDVPDYSKEAKEAKAKVNEVLKSEELLRYTFFFYQFRSILLC